MKRSALALMLTGALALTACTQMNAAEPPPARGYGPGPGMMGGGYGPGYGYGPGMMGGWGALPADLTAEQRGKMAEIQRDLRKQQWPLMEQMQEAMWDNGSAPPDEKAERQQYDRVSALHKQMFENMLASRKRMEAVLTPEQREQVRKGWGGR
jgi:Spy/CpxP family protein refolding chaperone